MQLTEYGEGSWFAVPLKGAGFAAGIAARIGSHGNALGYFFGPRRPSPPGLADVMELSAAQSLLVGIFSPLGIESGNWPLLGSAHEWDRDAWPMPVFLRHEELSGRSFRVYYDDSDLDKRPREERMATRTKVAGHPDQLMGSGYVEARLSGMLPQVSPI